MRIAFTGSRHWTNERQIENYLRNLVAAYGRAQLEICHGGAKNGVDAIVRKYAAALEINQQMFPVRGGPTGIDGNHRGAPLNRNKRMLVTFAPDQLVAFRAAGKSNGTDNTIKNAEKLNIPYVIIEEEIR